ncbi:Replication factor C subunit 2 [Halotydeus destructor]|nr:Replication factor C subunit 2 [Halotydeus destructor]
MTEGAQQALRRTMEIYSKTTRFALACNTSEKIIEPIQSRCAVVRFIKIPDPLVAKRVEEICKIEHVPYQKDGLEAVVYTAQGDMRQALNNLQSTFDGFDNVTSENVFKVCDEPHPLLIRQLLQMCSENKYESAYEVLSSLWKQGYSAEDVLANMFRNTKSSDKLNETLKLEFVKAIGTTHMRVAQGVSSLLQLAALLSRLCEISSQS